jgi:hypothetical protein
LKFTQTGTFKADVLEKPVSINPLEKVQDIFFDNLDYFLGFLANEKSVNINEYVNNLKVKYQRLVNRDYVEDVPEDVMERYSDFENMAQYPGLTRAALYYFLHLMQLEDRDSGDIAEVSISMRALIQAWTFPSYYLLEALIETIGRKDALKLYKRYITHYHRDHPSSDRKEVDSLKHMLEERLSGDTTSSDWIIVHTMLEDGKYAFKNENCPTCVDAMVDLPDVEIKYLVCCYGDYQKFRNYYGDHIILTMEHTLMEGDPYCSRVLHDTRIDYDLRHPPKEFWDNFQPGKEEVAKKYYQK